MLNTIGNIVVSKTICSNVKRLLTELNCEIEPIYVKCVPEKEAQLNDCFSLVEKRIKSHGGSAALGWQISKSKLLVEAIFHAIWKAKDGELIDISPKPVPLDEILFIQDREIEYEGKQVDNIRLNITENRLVDDLIKVCEASFRLQNIGERAYQHALTLKDGEAQAHKIFESAKPLLEVMALQGLNHQSPCLCNSGKKYKVCHGKILRELAESI